MKKLLLILLSAPLFCTAQIKIPKLFGSNTSFEIITYEQANDIKFAKQYKNNTKFDTYLTKDNAKIKIGDTLTLGNAFTESANKKYNPSDVFTNIYIGDIKDVNMDNYNHLPYDNEGNKVIVHSIYVRHETYTGYNPLKNRKETPLYIILFVKPVKDGIVSSILGYPRITIINLEKAFNEGEVINPNPALTRSEAIRKLKESKDLFDLNMLTEEDYNKIKNKLTPIINNK